MDADGWLGAELGGYRIDALIGHGGMGVVYRATHLRLQRPAALKLLAGALATDADYRRRFEREARMAASLEHPHIVAVYDAGYAHGVLYLAMRYIDGVNLEMIIEDEAPMSLDRVGDLLEPVADALDTAHRAGLVHRDVKPANVLVAATLRPGGSQQAYLCDFGIAKQTATGSSLTWAGQVLGTLQYCSPEQIQGQPVDGRTDQYALGCVAFHCLTGQVPFPRDEPAAVMFAHVSADPPRVSAHHPGLPKGVDDVIIRALAKQPPSRFPDCTSFIHALRAPSHAASTVRRPPPTPGRPPPWPSYPPPGPLVPGPSPPGPTAEPQGRRVPAAVLVLVALAVVLLISSVFGGLYLTSTGPAPAPAQPPQQQPQPLAKDANIAGTYALNRSVISCTGFDTCYTNPMNIRIDGCSGSQCTMTWSEGWARPHTLTFNGTTWQASGSDEGVNNCNNANRPGSIKLELTVASAAVVDGVWKAQTFRGTYSFESPAFATCTAGQGTVKIYN